MLHAQIGHAATTSVAACPKVVMATSNVRRINLETYELQDVLPAWMNAPRKALVFSENMG